MSRMQQQPFPSTSRSRGNTNPPVAYDGSRVDDNTLPLAINRQPARSITASSSTGSMASARASPARPARSERRPRHASQLSVSSMASRDMIFDEPEPIRPSTSRTHSNGTNFEEDPASPPALKAVLNAFQQAGAQRKRAMTNGTIERERERERELEEEAQRQKRIREHVPGRRTNGRIKATGNIDGTSMRSS